MQDLSSLICQEPGCPLGTSGTCLEGFDDPHKCPHAKEAPSAVISETADDGDTNEPFAIPSDWKSVGGGYELTVEEANGITASHETKVIVLAGEPDAGKSTLLATIYELFSKGQIPDYVFSGTETILAFERACFPSRIASGNRKADTERTRHLRPRFYHLCVRHLSGRRERQHLLLGDVSGEAFQRASDNLAEARKLAYLKRADVFVLILDGEKLQSKADRQDVLQKATLIFRALLQAEVLTPNTVVQVLISKFDCFNPDDDNSNRFLALLKDDLGSRFAKMFRSYMVKEVAARPNNDRVVFAFGVEDLLAPWLQDHLSEWQAQTPVYRHGPEMRESAQYLWKIRGTRPND